MYQVNMNARAQISLSVSADGCSGYQLIASRLLGQKVCSCVRGVQVEQRQTQMYAKVLVYSILQTSCKYSL